MQPKNASPTRYTCREYRQEMILLGLQKRLAAPDLSPEEREALLKEIEQIEHQMGMG